MLDSVLSVQPRSPLDALARLQALKEFLRLPDAAMLAAANKRIANLLKKTQLDPATAVDPGRFTVAAEQQLHDALLALYPGVTTAMRQGHYAETLSLLAGLRAAIDTFFEQVLVMDANPDLRNNRLALLRAVQVAFGGVADLSRLPG
jgi:glycyl-tRNA synthetase beta chain